MLRPLGRGDAEGRQRHGLRVDTLPGLRPHGRRQGGGVVFPGDSGVVCRYAQSTPDAAEPGRRFVADRIEAQVDGGHCPDRLLGLVLGRSQLDRLRLRGGHNQAAQLAAHESALDILLFAGAVDVVAVEDVEWRLLVDGRDDAHFFPRRGEGLARGGLTGGLAVQDNPDHVRDLAHLGHHVIQQGLSVTGEHGVPQGRGQQCVGPLHMGVGLGVGADMGQQTLGDDEGEGELVGASTLKNAGSWVCGVINGLAQLEECLISPCAAGVGGSLDRRSCCSYSRLLASMQPWHLTGGEVAPSKVISTSSKRVSWSTRMVTVPSMWSLVVYELTSPSV